VRTGRAAFSFWKKAYEDGLTGLAAMVAYNLLLSIFPLTFVALFIAGRVLESAHLERSVLVDLQGLFPSATEGTLRDVLERIQDSSTSFGIVALIASVWVGASFWGALDTAFCRIYHLPCRSWVRQKLFALSMLVVVLLFVAASVLVPTLQSILVQGADDLPFGLAKVRGVVFALSLAGGLLVLFGALCLIYFRVPKGRIPWRCIWPGALGATLAMGVVDYAFPLYLQNVSTIARLGSTLVFVLIGLLWFYALALILLAGAVINDLRFERQQGPQAP
jgi:YihY family inner membrane protein